MKLENPRQINLEVKRRISQIGRDTKEREIILDKCETSLLKALRIWPDHLILQSNLGAVYILQLRYEEACQKLGGLIRQGHFEQHSVLNLGLVKTLLGHRDAYSFLQDAKEFSARDDTFTCNLD